MARRAEAPVRLTLQDDFSRRLRRPRRDLTRFASLFGVVRTTGTGAFRGVAVSANAAGVALRRSLPALRAYSVGLRGANLATVGLAGSVKTLGLGLAGVGAGAAVNEFRKYQVAIRRAEGANSSFAKSREEVAATIEAVGRRTGFAQSELATEVEQLAKAGLDASEANKVLAASADFAVARGQKLGDVVKVVRAAIRAYGLEADNARDITDALAKATSVGAIEANELQNTFGLLAGSARQAGIPLGQVFAALADITSTGQNAAQASTALNRLFGLINKGVPPEVAERFPDLAKLLNVAQLQSDLAEDPAQGIVTFLRRVQRAIPSQDIISSLFPDVRGRRAVIALFRDDLKGLENALREVEDRSGATNAAFQGVEDTIDIQLRQSMAAFRDLLLEIGKALAPAAFSGAETLEDVLRGVSESIAENRTEIALFLIDLQEFVGQFFEAAQKIADERGLPAALAFVGEQGVNLLVNALVSGLPLMVEAGLQLGEGVVEGVLSGLTKSIARQPTKLIPVIARALGIDESTANALGAAASTAGDTVVDELVGSILRSPEERAAALEAAGRQFGASIAKGTSETLQGAVSGAGIEFTGFGESEEALQRKIGLIRSELSETNRQILAEEVEYRTAIRNQVPPLKERLDIAEALFAQQKKQTEELRKQAAIEVNTAEGGPRAADPALNAISAESQARARLKDAIVDQAAALARLKVKRDELRQTLSGIKRFESEGIITSEKALAEEEAALARFRTELFAADSAFRAFAASAKGSASDTAADVGKLRTEFAALYEILGGDGPRDQFLRNLKVIDAGIESLFQRFDREDVGTDALARQVDLGQLNINDFRQQANTLRTQQLAGVNTFLDQLKTLQGTEAGKDAPGLQLLIDKLQEAKGLLSVPIAAEGEGADFLGSLENQLQLAAEAAGNLQALSVDLSGAFVGAFDGILDSVLGLNDGFQQFAANFLLDIGRMITRALFFRAVLALIPGLNNGGDPQTDGVLGVFGLNSGGLAGRDGRRMPLRLNSGSRGMVPGPRGVNADIIPAMLTPGEFVMNRSAVKNVGVDLLRHLNGGGGLEDFGIGAGARSISAAALSGRRNEGGEAGTVGASGAGNIPFSITTPDPQSADRLIAQGGNALREWAIANSSLIQTLAGQGRA